MGESDVTEVGISHRYSLIITALKSQLLKRNAKTKRYRDYSPFISDILKEDFEKGLKKNITEHSNFEYNFLELVHNHEPIQKK